MNKISLNLTLIISFVVSTAFAILESIPSLKGSDLEKDIAALVNSNQIKTVDYLTAVTMM